MCESQLQTDKNDKWFWHRNDDDDDDYLMMPIHKCNGIGANTNHINTHIDRDLAAEL